MILPKSHSTRERRKQMAILKVIEVMAESDKSWEDAAKEAIREASQTVEHIRSIYIKESKALVENNKIVKYRIIGKISFEVRQ